MFGLQDEKRNQSQKAFGFIGRAFGIGLTTNVVFAFQAATWGQFFAVGTVGLMYSAASSSLDRNKTKSFLTKETMEAGL